jgi:3-keto-5-aminohexanoate cleavage enzyme
MRRARLCLDIFSRFTRGIRISTIGIKLDSVIEFRQSDVSNPMQKLIITAALVGSRPTKAMNPAVPYTPEEIAAEAIACCRAGATVAHIHVRDPQSGAPSHEISLFREVVERVREACDILLNLTTSGFHIASADVGERRLDPLGLAPELCSFDIGSVNFVDGVFVNPPEWGEMAAKRMQQARVKPEIEVFEPGHIAQARALIEDGWIDSPPYFQLCMGVGWGIPASAENLRFMHSQLPEGAIWSAMGVGRMQSEMVRLAAEMGGHVRVGFEDNIYLEKDVLASSNAQFVERVVRLADEVGREVASPAEARRILDCH